MMPLADRIDTTFKTQKNAMELSVLMIFPQGIKPTQWKNQWHKIANNLSEIDFNANGLAEIDIHGKMLCIAKHNDQVFACTQKCPHAGGLLVDGYIDSAWKPGLPPSQIQIQFKERKEYQRGRVLFKSIYSRKKRIWRFCLPGRCSLLGTC